MAFTYFPHCSPFVFRNLGREFGRRKIYFAGVLMMAAILLIKLSGIPYHGVRESWWAETLREDLGPVAVSSLTDFSYDDGTAVKAERWKFLSGEYASLPEETRSLTVVYFEDSRTLWKVWRRISPSGRYFAAHTGPLTAETLDLGQDENRRVWAHGNLLVLYTGGDPQVEAEVTACLGPPELDGRAPDPESWAFSRWETLTSWMYFPDLTDVLLISLGLAFFLILALRAPKKPAASVQNPPDGL